MSGTSYELEINVTIFTFRPERVFSPPIFHSPSLVFSTDIFLYTIDYILNCLVVYDKGYVFGGHDGPIPACQPISFCAFDLLKYLKTINDARD